MFECCGSVVVTVVMAVLSVVVTVVVAVLSVVVTVMPVLSECLSAAAALLLLWLLQL